MATDDFFVLARQGYIVSRKRCEPTLPCRFFCLAKPVFFIKNTATEKSQPWTI